MRNLARSAWFTVAALALGLSLGAAPVAAVTAAAWTLKPGGKFTGSGTATLGDGATGAKIACASHLGGSFKSGSGQANPIGKLTSVTFSHCDTTALPFMVTTPASASRTWPIDGASYAGGVTHGKITGVKISIKGNGCSTTIAGLTATSRGTVNFTYSNTPRALKVSGGNLHYWNSSGGCLGLFNPGDPATYTASYTISPAQKITSP
jgi:hypothetical protein